MADYNRRHWQHTKEFEYELNSTINKQSQPFRMIDNIMVIGKFKGKHISDVPKYYLKWLLKNYKGLSIGSRNRISELL